MKQKITHLPPPWLHPRLSHLHHPESLDLRRLPPRLHPPRRPPLLWVHPPHPPHSLPPLLVPPRLLPLLPPRPRCRRLYSLQHQCPYPHHPQLSRFLIRVVQRQQGPHHPHLLLRHPRRRRPLHRGFLRVLHPCHPRH